MPQYVTIDECEQIRDRNEAGETPGDIADDIGRAVRTVRKHCRDGCKHRRERGGGYNDHPLPGAITAAIREMANEKNRIPAKATWDLWPSKPCCSDTVVAVMGSWSNAVEAAGLSSVAPNASEMVRELAYERPEIAGQPKHDNSNRVWGD